MSDTSVYPQCITELYQSEVMGEGAFLALLPVAKNERDRHHFLQFLQLETETKARLRPLLAKYGLEMNEQMDPAVFTGIAEGYLAADWPEFLGGLKPMIETFLARFKEIAALGPEEDQEILQSMIPHEESFLHWIDRELAGEPGSLDAVEQLLQYPCAGQG